MTTKPALQMFAFGVPNEEDVDQLDWALTQFITGSTVAWFSAIPPEKPLHFRSELPGDGEPQRFWFETAAAQGRHGPA